MMAVLIAASTASEPDDAKMVCCSMPGVTRASAAASSIRTLRTPATPNRAFSDIR